MINQHLTLQLTGDGAGVGRGWERGNSCSAKFACQRVIVWTWRKRSVCVRAGCPDQCDRKRVIHWLYRGQFEIVQEWRYWLQRWGHPDAYKTIPFLYSYSLARKLTAQQWFFFFFRSSVLLAFSADIRFGSTVLISLHFAARAACFVSVQSDRRGWVYNTSYTTLCWDCLLCHLTT